MSRGGATGVLAAVIALTAPAAAQVRLVQQSSPLGIVAADQLVPTGPALTVVAPADETGNLRFIGWTFRSFPPNATPCTGNTVYDVPGARDAFGSVTNPVLFNLFENVCATANYLGAGVDSDADLVPDWFEWVHFGNLSANALTDAESPPDGFVVAEEFRTGLHPRVREQFVHGGVSDYTSPPVLLTLDPDWFIVRTQSQPRGLLPDTVDAQQLGTAYSFDALEVTQGFRFGVWSINGARRYDALGRALDPVTGTIAGATTAVATYVPEAADSDGDGIPDWFELGNAGGTGVLPGDDPDGDGIPVGTEFRLGLLPGIRETFIHGGVSDYTSPPVSIALSGARAWFVRSAPLGLIPSRSGTDANGFVVTGDAPAVSGAFRFSYWDSSGTRMLDALGLPRNPVSVAIADANVELTANYFGSSADTDADGLPDWFERGLSGGDGLAPGDDADGDGIGLRDEFRLALNPRVRESFIDGGVSDYTAPPVLVDIRPFPRVREILVDGLPEALFANQPPEAGAGFQSGTFAIAGDAAPALGDLDGDNDADLLVAGTNGVLRAYRNGGSPVVPSLDRVAALETALAPRLAGNARPALAIGNVTGNRVLGTGDRFGDVVVGGATGDVAVLRFNGNLAVPAFDPVQTLATGLSRVLPALADLDGDGWTDLLLVAPDGTTRRYPHGGNPSAPFGSFVANALPAPVANAVSIAARDITEDGRTDVVIADAAGRLWEFHRQPDGAFSLASAIFAGTFNGFATRLSAALTDLDGDGDSDVIAGFAQGGLLYLRNQVEKLAIDPPARTLLVNTGMRLRPRAPPAGVSPLPPGYAQGTVTWRLVENNSGATIDASGGQYVAGPTRGVVDVIEAVDDRGAAGRVTGRAYVNVIGPSDQTQSGKAVIIAGSTGLQDSAWTASNALANKAYLTLLFRGFRKENIRYLSLEPSQDVDGNGLYDDIHAATTFQTAQDALRNFGRGASELFIALIDHGGLVPNDGVFVLRNLPGGSERLLASEVRGWLDEVQQSTPGGTDINLMMEFCFAGAFLQRLQQAPASSGRRVMAASTSPTEEARLLLDGRVAYAETFLTGLQQGFDLRTASGLGAAVMRTYGQNGQLDDNGNGVADEPGDGAVAAATRLGPSFVVGLDLPIAEDAGAPQVLAPGTAEATIALRGVTSVYPIERGWCTVLGPNAVAPGVAPITNLPEIELAFDRGERAWTGRYAGFSANGAYRLSCQVRDVWGSSSLPATTQVTQTGYDQRVLVVVAGATNSARFEEANAVGNAVYRTALLRGVPRARLRYLNSRTVQDVDGDGDTGNDIAGPATGATLDAAITGWAAGADELTVYVVSGSGGGAALTLGPGDIRTAAQVDALLDAFQVSPRQVANLLLEAPGAGAFIPALAPPGCPANCPEDAAAWRDRMVVATTQVGRDNLLANAGVVSASQMLASNFLAGRSIGDALIESQPPLGTFTAPDQVMQVDVARVALRGAEDSRPGTPNDPGDRRESRSRYFGPGFSPATVIPEIAQRLPRTQVAVGRPLRLWVDGVTAARDLARVWAVVRRPDGALPFPEVDLLPNPVTGRWEGAFGDTAQAGEYQVLFYARDAQGASSQIVGSRVSVPYGTPVVVGGTATEVAFATEVPAIEEGRSASVVVSLARPQVLPLRVPLVIRGTAANQVDFRVTRGSVDSPAEIVFAPGEVQATLTLAALADAVAGEGKEMVSLALGEPSEDGVSLGERNTIETVIAERSTDTVFGNGFEAP